LATDLTAAHRLARELSHSPPENDDPVNNPVAFAPRSQPFQNSATCVRRRSAFLDKPQREKPDSAKRPRRFCVGFIQIGGTRRQDCQTTVSPGPVGQWDREHALPTRPATAL